MFVLAAGTAINWARVDWSLVVAVLAFLVAAGSSYYTFALVKVERSRLHDERRPVFEVSIEGWNGEPVGRLTFRNRTQVDYDNLRVNLMREAGDVPPPVSLVGVSVNNTPEDGNLLPIALDLGPLPRGRTDWRGFTWRAGWEGPLLVDITATKGRERWKVTEPVELPDRNTVTSAEAAVAQSNGIREINNVTVYYGNREQEADDVTRGG